MNSLQQMLGKEDKIFQLLAASAEQALAAAQALRTFVDSAPELRTVQALVEVRRKDKAVTADLNEILCTTFVSSLEAEDIEALSNSIYKIPKTIEKIAERILLAPAHLNSVDLSGQIKLVESCTEVLLQMVREMGKGMSRNSVKPLNEQLQSLEGEADKTVLQMLGSIYNEKQDPGRVTFLKDIFELLEKATDRCRDAGNIIFRITLKNT
jgi:uncharacterized protein Yka (UPF0111/DUF47 family)